MSAIRWTPIPPPPIVLVVNHGKDVDVHIIGITGHELARVHTDLGEILEAGDLSIRPLGTHPDAFSGWRVVNYNHAARTSHTRRAGSMLTSAVDGARDVADVIDDIIAAHSMARGAPYTLVLGRDP